MAMTAVREVQTATANPDEDSATVIVDGAPEAGLLSSWLRDLIWTRRGPPTTAQTRPTQNPAPNPRQNGVVNPVPVAPAPSPEPAQVLPDPALPPSLPPFPPPAPTPAAAPAPDPGPSQAQNVAQNAVAAGITLDVHVRLTVREKLQTLVFSSAIGLRVDRTATFTEREIESLRQFQAAYDANFTALFRGKPMPYVVFYLVSLRADSRRSALGKTPTTSICVRGLRSDDEIRTFHQAMSRSATRRLYRGVRLSYERSLIERPAAEVSEEHDDFPSSLGDTMCGTCLVTRRPGHSPWASTIGGIVQVGDDLYALTSSHTPDSVKTASAATSLPDDTASSTLNVSNYDDDVESALVLDKPHLAPFSTPLKPPPINGTPRTHEWPAFSLRGWVLEHGGDWRLIPLSSSRCFPNSIPRELENSSTAGITYITESSRRMPFHGRVLALAGCNGLSEGTLRSSPAFLSGPGGPSTEVWAVVMDSKESLQKGDSGSWVVDNLGGWLGSVTAMSGGDAYILPAHVQLEQMRAHFALPVALPTPLRCYLELAAAPFFSGKRANEFAAMALTPDVLASSTGDAGETARTLAIEKGLFKMELEELLRMPGIRLHSMLTQPFAEVPSEIRVIPAFQTLRVLHSRLRLDKLDVSPADIRGILRSDDTQLMRRWSFLLPSSESSQRYLLGVGRTSKTVSGMLNYGEEDPDEPLSPAAPATAPATAPAQDESEHDKTRSRRRAAVQFLVNVIVVLGMSALAGMAALAALLQLQPDLRQVLSAAGSPGGVEALGPSVGLCLAAPLVWQDVIYLAFSLLAPSLQSPLPRLPTVAVLSMLVPAVTFARILFAVTIVYPLLAIDDSGNIGTWRIAAAAAAAPFLIDTVMNSPDEVDVGRREKRLLGCGWAMQRLIRRSRSTYALAIYFLVMYASSVAWDALAGYTFARVASNYGVGSIDFGAAVAAGAVFGTVSNLCRPLAFVIILGRFSGGKKKNRGREGGEEHREEKGKFPEKKAIFGFGLPEIFQTPETTTTPELPEILSPVMTPFGRIRVDEPVA